MEALICISMSILSCLLLYVSLYFIFFCKNIKSNGPLKNLPPGSSGWPVFGENIRFALLGPEKFVSDSLKRYSSPEIFQTSLLGQKVAVFCGPKANRFFFTNESKNNLATWIPLSVMKATAFPRYDDSSVNIEAARVQLMRCIHESLKPEFLKQFVPIMDSAARRHLERSQPEGWSSCGSSRMVRVHPLAKRYTFALACRIFLGMHEQDHAEKLASQFDAVATGLFSLPIALPGTAFSRAGKAGKMLRDEIVKLVQERRKEVMVVVENGREEETRAASERDLLARMILVEDENGQVMKDMDIYSGIIGLLLAAYSPSSSAMTFALKYLAELPHIFDKVYQEQKEIVKSKAGGPDDLLNWEDIQKMKYTWNVVREAMRLTPPSLGGFREVLQEFTYAGVTLPKGWKALWNVYSTNKDPKWFTNPEKFEPSRFEGSGPAPYTFLPFGRGRQMCPGKEFARLEILVFIHNVVKNFRLEIQDPHDYIIHHLAPFPKNGLLLKLLPH